MLVGWQQHRQEAAAQASLCVVAPLSTMHCYSQQQTQRTEPYQLIRAFVVFSPQHQSSLSAQYHELRAVQQVRRLP